jgi:Ca2+-transporting ATPase
VKATDPSTRQTDATDWHCLHPAEVSQQLGVDPAAGLSFDEAARRLARHGPNALIEAERRSVARMIADQFADVMILILLVAAVIAGVLGEAADTIAILVIVLLNATIGFVQEYRAEKAVAALRQMAAPSARVRRQGEIRELPAVELVPGDVVLLEAGNVVPADLRLVDVARLRVAEAALTGESQPVEKAAAAIGGQDLPLGDRLNMVFKGTAVAYGRATGIVVATGMGTELGRIASLLAGAEELKTPLQRRLAIFGKRLAIAVLVICAVVFAAGLLRGEPPALLFLTAVSLAVAAIPEALPAVVAISLALGAYKMAGQHALIRRLPAVETLGSITVICSDKTGTLTENRMRADAFEVAGESAPPALPARYWRAFFEALALCNDARVDHAGKIVGDPTEVALLEAAIESGLGNSDLAQRRPRIAELPFDSERKLMATAHRISDGVLVYVKGAPEALLERCTRQATNGDAAPDGGPLDRAVLRDRAHNMAAGGMRVLALACRRLDALPADLATVETDLTFLGFVGLIDPPRAEAAQAVAECRSAGITPVMITGDHPATALAIAKRLGIATDGGALMTGVELTALDDATLAARIRRTSVYARVDPAQKIRIVEALQAAGEVVAMTGDGVNDAPALKRADIGVAMGKVGTDVARESAHMVLLDDNFATIVRAVREGRRIYDNIRKFIKYVMACNLAEILTIFLAPFFGLPIPLLPIHILWINLVTDGLPGLMLVNERAEPDIMQRPPRAPGENIFAHGMWQHIVWVGMLMGGVTLLMQAWAMHNGSEHWQSMVFTVLTLSQLGQILAIRSEHASVFRIGLLSNRYLAVTVALTILLQMATLYVPVLNAVFKTQPLSASELGLCLALSTVVFIGVEIEKWLRRNGRIYRDPAPG